jgi:hypothetical protein
MPVARCLVQTSTTSDRRWRTLTSRRTPRPPRGPTMRVSPPSTDRRRERISRGWPPTSRASSPRSRRRRIAHGPAWRSRLGSRRADRGRMSTTRPARTLSELVASGIEVAIVSNSHGWIEGSLRALDLPAGFDPFAISAPASTSTSRRSPPFAASSTADELVGSSLSEPRVHSAGGREHGLRCGGRHALLRGARRPLL